MIAKTALESALEPFLQAVSPGVYRPEGAHLKDHVELKATLDNSGNCTKVELTVSPPIPEHPALGPALQELLEALAQAILKEPLNLRPGQSRTAQGINVSWAGDRLTFGKKKGLLGLFT